MRMILNRKLYGFLIGILMPVIVILLAYMIKFYGEISFVQFYKGVVVQKIYSQVLALGVFFGNLIPFIIFIKKEFIHAGRGVVMATLLYTLLIVILRLFI